MPVSTGARSAFEQAVLDRQKQLAQQSGRSDRIIQPKEIEALAAEFFGNLQVPEGAKVLTQTPLEITYETADGKQYRLFRNLSGNLGADVGRVETKLLSSPIASQGPGREGDLATQLSGQLQKLNELYGGQLEALARGERPAGLETGTSDYLKRLDDIVNRLSAPASLSNLDPETKAALDAINSANQAKLTQQFQDESGNLVAQLFGRGVNASSIAGEQANRLLQGQGLVRSQSQSEASQRELSVRQFLSQLGQQNLALAGQTLLEGGGLNLKDFGAVQGLAESRAGRQQQLLTDLINSLLQREVSGQEIGLKGRELDINEMLGLGRQQLERDQFEVAAKAQRQQARRSLIGSIIGGGASIGLGLAGGGLGLGGLFGGKSGNSSGGYYSGGTYIGE